MTKAEEKFTEYEIALLDVMHSEDIRDISKLYIVQHLVNTGNKVDSVNVPSDNCPLPDLQMRPNSTTDFNNILKSVQSI